MAIDDPLSSACLDANDPRYDAAKAEQALARWLAGGLDPAMNAEVAVWPKGLQDGVSPSADIKARMKLGDQWIATCYTISLQELTQSHRMPQIFIEHIARRFKREFNQALCQAGSSLRFTDD